MPHVLPSQVVDYLNNRPNNIQSNDSSIHIGMDYIGYLSGLIRIIKEIPTEYLTISGKDYTNLIFALESISAAIRNWHPDGHRVQLSLKPYEEKNPHIKHSLLDLIESLLKKCPDEVPSPETTELSFIDDEYMRKSIRLDLSSAYTALHNVEWKAATVLAGSVCEALLMWAILKVDKNISEKNKRKGLAYFITQAIHLNIITENTQKIVDVARDYRNLIHPERAQRLGQSCDRASAMTALAAAESIIRNLKSKNGFELSE